MIGGSVNHPPTARPYKGAVLAQKLDIVALEIF